ncbi:glycoside hydrolase family 30 protein [Flammeovirga agarivorans]|uniref:Glycoside hydrolase family 30 protein n=1 Tax=Flammeovirga agarivorans TaxID=2726742 RepID=A0A7X8SQS1_9BACT|nr:glycoside hydrolase family 30 protein [Flammeovirga agarivorans]NLR94568.1 glycoside hydrolase family 30 protein [Flammeovirga agarivorans]
MKRILTTALAAVLLIGCAKENQLPKEKEITDLSSSTPSKVSVFTTAKDTELKMSNTGQSEFKKADQAKENEVSIFINPEKQYQEFLGIGGAITDASAEVFAKLSKEKQEELLNAYYGEDGIDYTIIRTSIHSCDFSSGSHTYVEEGDKELKTFDIEHDRKYRLPMIKSAIKKADENLTFYASPWSPPAFMKGKKDMLQGGSLLPEYFDSWANYYIKFIQEYEKEGIDVWGVTIQNEPMAVQTWESCIYSAEQERDFLKNHLGPAFEKAGFADKKIVVWDHNRDLIVNRANTIFGDPEAAKYAWGIGFHWYETWAGGEPMFDNLGIVKENFPDKQLLFTEGCNEGFDASKYQYWPNAERYGKSMINDFNKGTVGWTDWNILLDQNGGPNHVGNFCFSPIHADTDKNELIFTPSYYYIGHFSKYIRPGARRISTAVSRSVLEATTFLNTDGRMVSVVMNSTDEPISYAVYVDGQETQVEIPARAIQTLLYSNDQKTI